ncbi:pectinesterase/pectinesterase inhibitor 13 [Artemisia annua]|uniref:Pectinesterase/pectinesterase inhibitor 13 n=1 Tax=Artemisia annua TaxID=35608 RepID=A0A2U1N1F4_ARTAN|nr:pectinesterase/pectinesterase inhibitor 13 [Artemisia annua]
MNAGFIELQIESGDNLDIEYKIHPIIDNEWFSSEKIPITEDPNIPLPAELRKQVGTVAYIECRSKTQQGLRQLKQWSSILALDTCFYGKYANVVGAAGMDRRVKWKGYKLIKDRNEDMQCVAGAFVQGNGRLKITGAPFYLGLKG